MDFIMLIQQHFSRTSHRINPAYEWVCVAGCSVRQARTPRGSMAVRRLYLFLFPCSLAAIELPSPELASIPREVVLVDQLCLSCERGLLVFDPSLRIRSPSPRRRLLCFLGALFM